MPISPEWETNEHLIQCITLPSNTHFHLKDLEVFFRFNKLKASWEDLPKGKRDSDTGSSHHNTAFFLQTQT